MNTPKIIVITGPPSSGKTTQCSLVLDELKYLHRLDFDKLLKSKQNEYPIIKELRDRGKLKSGIPADVVKSIFDEYVSNKTEEDAILFYRGPSTVDEAVLLPTPQLFIVLSIDTNTAIQRASTRRVDEVSGVTYNLIHDEQKIKELGIAHRLKKRFGDDSDLLKARIERHKARMELIVEYYSNKTVVETINGNAPQKDITEKIIELVNKIM
ncbi:adenylate kinase [Acrasis kona]|uniref:Adenylate kinase n=1 Tax=Acrasis kona TaxID=1008807 RepID=A0AAW2YZK3_9EUKA